MLAALVISLLMSVALGVELRVRKPKSDGTQLDRQTLRAFWILCVALTIAFGAAYFVERHYRSEESLLEQRVDDLEHHVNDLEQQVADLDENKVDRR